MSSSYELENANILAGIDVQAEYARMGVRFRGEPRASGAVECWAVGRDDASPSAWVNVHTGRYGDSKTGVHMRLWDFAAKHGGFADWQAARQHFADKAGVKLSGRSKPKVDNWRELLDFHEWTDGLMSMLRLWCERHKPGTSPDAARASGGQPVTKYVVSRAHGDKPAERKKMRGVGKCLALPGYGKQLLDAEPVCWVLWQMGGDPFSIYRGKGREPDRVKMMSCGGTGGALMGMTDIKRLLDDADKRIKVIKSAGPTDMMAWQTWFADPAGGAEIRDDWAVVTLASTETGDVPESAVQLLAGREVYVIHDADTAGERGLLKWRAACQAHCDLRVVMAPYRKREKKGLDARDWLCGVRELVT